MTPQPIVQGSVTAGFPCYWIERLRIMLNDIDVAQRAPDKSGQSGLLLLRLQLAL